MITQQDIRDRTPAFANYMQELDRRLVAEHVAVPGRQLVAMQRIALDLQIEIIVAGPDPTGMGEAISEWFTQRYGDRLKVDLSPGRAVVFVRGDPLVMRLPLIIGQWDGILDVTTLFEGFTQPLFAEMSEGEMHDLIAIFSWFRDRFDRIEQLPSSIRANIDTAIRQMMAQLPHYGESKWASLQFAEKTLKHFILKRGKQPPRTHDLQNLLAVAEREGLPPGRTMILRMIQCAAAVRYEDGISLDEAVLAHHASIDLASFVAEHLDTKPNRERAETTKAEFADLIVSFEYGIENSHNGNLLFNFAMALGEPRKILFAAAHCFWLVNALSTSIAKGRHEDVRHLFEAGRDLRNAPPTHALRLFNAHRPAFGPADYEGPLDQVLTIKAYDDPGHVVLELGYVVGSAARLIFFSELVPLFLEAVRNGIEEGRTRGLFADR